MEPRLGLVANRVTLQGFPLLLGCLKVDERGLLRSEEKQLISGGGAYLVPDFINKMKGFFENVIIRRYFCDERKRLMVVFRSLRNGVSNLVQIKFGVGSRRSVEYMCWNLSKRIRDDTHRDEIRPKSH
jgi:hypothetical protein